MENKKLVKITFQYEDGSKRVLSENAQEWIDDVNGMCFFMQNRVINMNPFVDHKYNWEDVGKWDEHED